jgi:hypothetical protein
VNRRVVAIIGALAILSIAFGCAEIYGLGDYTEGDASVVVDVATEPLPVYDGGCTCAPSIPTGWTPIAYDQAFRSACATDYGNPIDISEGITADPATCACGCSVSANCNSLLVTSGDSGTCNNQTSQSVPWDGGCTTITTINGAGSKVSIKASGVGSCTPDASVTKTNPSFMYQGRLCELLVAPATTGCATGVCVPSAAPFVFCVHQNGVATCPAGYPTQHVVGTQINDGRGCSACTCDFDAGGSSGCGGTATLWTGGACNAQAQAINVDGTCQAVAANQMYKSLTYQATSSGASCTPSQPTATGTATFSDSQTVCCTQ